MKKILIVITKGELGGAQVFVATLARALHKKGHHVTVAIGEGEYLKTTLHKEKIPVLEFKWLKRTSNPFANILFALEIKNFLWLNQFDVVHFNSSNALFGALGAKYSRTCVATVFTLHGLSVLDQNYNASKIVKKAYLSLFKFLFKFIDEKVFVSNTNLDYAKDIGLVSDGAVIYNGIDTGNLHFLPRKNAREFFGENVQLDMDDPYVIGSIGRLAYPKNYEFLINTFPEIIKKIPNAIAVIIGEGPERDKYAKLIEQNDLTQRIFLVGALEDAYRYIKAFDLFVLPSEYEGMSITLIETLFAEVPVLASHVGGTPELLDNPTHTYALNNTADFLKKLDILYSQKEFGYSEIEKTRRNNFDGELMAEKYLKRYGQNPIC